MHQPSPRRLQASRTTAPTPAGTYVMLAIQSHRQPKQYRRIVGWAMATHLRTELVMDALDMALKQRRPAHVIHHSDQGCQYTSIAFGQRCRTANVQPSMGSAGDAYDNAMCESFFVTIEADLLDRQRFATPAHARLAVFDYIEGWYNPRRRHSALQYLPPIAYKRRSLSLG